VVVENGKVEKIVTAGSMVEAMMVDLDAIKNLPDDAINFETMEDMLTWHTLAQNDAAVGQLQGRVFREFVDRGMPLA
jgi:hypothetical protein